MNRMATSGYGILAEYENIVTSSYQSGYCLPNGAVVLGSPSAESLENSTSSSTLNADQMCYGAANGDCYGNMGSRECYGSFKNSSMSTIESYNRYDEGYRRVSIQEASTAPPVSYYGDEFYGTESYCQENEGAVILSSQNVHSLLTSPSAGETSGGAEQTYFCPSYQKKTQGIASTPLVAWNIINLLLSTSLLAFPFALSQAGFIVLPFILLIALMTNYTSRILIGMMYEKPLYRKRRIRVRLDYIDLAQDVFNSHKGALVIQSIQVVEMLSICILNICVLGSLAHEIMPNINIQLCTVIVAMIALPTFFIQKLVVIGWMQTIGVFSLTIGLFLIEGLCVARYSQLEFSTIPLYNLKRLPIALGIIIYAFGIQGVMPGLEEQMKKPNKFGYVINFTFFIAVIVQCVFSVTNAALYGSRTQQVITVDLQSHFALGVATACFIGISILCHFSLPTFVVMEKLDMGCRRIFPSCCFNNSENQESRCNTFLSITLRVIVMSFSVGVAVLLPYFAYLMAFIGCAVTVLLSLIIPCWFHLKLKGDTFSWCQKFIDIFIILSGFVCLGAGSFFSFEAIYSDYIS